MAQWYSASYSELEGLCAKPYFRIKLRFKALRDPQIKLVQYTNEHWLSEYTNEHWLSE